MEKLLNILLTIYWVGFVLAVAISSMIIIFSYQVISDEDATILNTLATIILSAFSSWFFIIKVLKAIFFKILRK